MECMCVSDCVCVFGKAYLFLYDGNSRNNNTAVMFSAEEQYKERKSGKTQKMPKSIVLVM